MKYRRLRWFILALFLCAVALSCIKEESLNCPSLECNRDALLSYALALGYFKSWTNPCPPPTTLLSAGTHTINTNGGTISLNFRINQDDVLRQYQFTVYEKPGQNVGIRAADCSKLLSENGSETVSQTENYQLSTSSRFYYYFIFLGAINDSTIQFQIPSAPL